MYAEHETITLSHTKHTHTHLHTKYADERIDLLHARALLSAYLDAAHSLNMIRVFATKSAGSDTRHTRGPRAQARRRFRHRIDFCRDRMVRVIFSCAPDSRAHRKFARDMSSL